MQSSPYIISVLFPRKGDAVAHVNQVVDGGHNTNPVDLDEVLSMTTVGQVDTETQAEMVEEFVNAYLASTPGLSSNSDFKELKELIEVPLTEAEEKAILNNSAW